MVGNNYGNIHVLSRGDSDRGFAKREEGVRQLPTCSLALSRDPAFDCVRPSSHIPLTADTCVHIAHIIEALLTHILICTYMDDM